MLYFFFNSTKSCGAPLCAARIINCEKLNKGRVEVITVTVEGRNRLGASWAELWPEGTEFVWEVFSDGSSRNQSCTKLSNTTLASLKFPKERYLISQQAS